MRKSILITSLLLSLSSLVAADTGSSVVLYKSGEIKQANSLVIPLDPLIKKATYNVSCLITNSATESTDVQFDVNAKEKLQYSQFSINDEVLSFNQASVKNGESKMTVLVSSDGNGNTLVIKNLNFDAPVTVSNCVAKPVTYLADAKSSLGYFTAYNDTNKTVTIGVGNYFPTPYKISPHSSAWVSVSSNNQNIHIKDIN